MDLKHIWEGFEITLLVILGLLTLLRMQEHQYLYRFKLMDPKIPLGRYPIACSLSQTHDRLRRYRPPRQDIRLEPYSPVEFILHDYTRPGISCLHPYYHLYLDEAREGSQMVVFRRYRAELLSGFTILGFLTFGLANQDFHLFSIMALLLTGLSLYALSDRRTEEVLEHLMRSAGILTQSRRPDGGEQQQRVAF